MEASHRVRLHWGRLVAVTAVVVVLFAAANLALRFLRDDAVAYDDIRDHFKYGSIGSEPGGSVFSPVGGLLPPAKIFAALPTLCADKINGGYEDFGLISQEGHRYPIGISERRRFGTDFVGVNCSICHTGTYRAKPGEEQYIAHDGAEITKDGRHIVLGMPGNRLELQRLFQFVIACSLDDRFTPDNVLAVIEAAEGPLGPLDEYLYRTEIIPRSRRTTKSMNDGVKRIMGDEVTAWGAGRVDTFNPYKSAQFNWPLDRLPLAELNGASDYPSLWNQRPRLGMQLHWDGNNRSLNERNLSAALGAGVTPVTVDHDSINRIKKWAMDLPPPKYPFPIDAARAAKGASVYARYCADCHGDSHFRDAKSKPTEFKWLGKVTPLAELGTDPYRLRSYTWQFSENQYTLYPASASATDIACDSPDDLPRGDYQFKCFRKSEGYSNQPLDGIWIKAPYLHNGSVPTMRDLLEPHERRPAKFYRGYDVYDTTKLGFVHDVPVDTILVGGHKRTKQMSLYDTSPSFLGNSNWGHEGPAFGTELSDDEKDAIVEYMKTF
jgi:mono/diheme cytochrome c family protein